MGISGWLGWKVAGAFGVSRIWGRGLAGGLAQQPKQDILQRQQQSYQASIWTKIKYQPMQTPAKTSRVSISRSLIRSMPARLAKSTRKSRHTAMSKGEKLDYDAILNKLLCMDNYNKFISYASKHVDRSVLECTKKVAELKIMDIGGLLVTDARFVRKLAQLSPDPQLIIQAFKSVVTFHKRVLINYERCLADPDYQDDSIGTCKENQTPNKLTQTEDQKQFRLAGLARKEKSAAKEKTMTFQEYIVQQNLTEAYQKMKKQSAIKRVETEQKKQQEQHSKSSLKRISFYRPKDQFLYAQPFNHSNPSTNQYISPDQLEILSRFPKVCCILHRCPQIQVTSKEAVLGYYKNYRVSQVVIEVQWCEELGRLGFRPYYPEIKIIHIALVIEPLPPDALPENPPQLQDNDDIKLYLTH